MCVWRWTGQRRRGGTMSGKGWGKMVCRFESYKEQRYKSKKTLVYDRYRTASFWAADELGLSRRGFWAEVRLVSNKGAKSVKKLRTS